MFSLKLLLILNNKDTLNTYEKNILKISSQLPTESVIVSHLRSTNHSVQQTEMLVSKITFTVKIWSRYAFRTGIISADTSKPALICALVGVNRALKSWMSLACTDRWSFKFGCQLEYSYESLRIFRIIPSKCLRSILQRLFRGCIREPFW